MIAVFPFIFVNPFDCEQMQCYMSLGDFNSGQLLTQKENKVRRMKKGKGSYASLVCCQGERKKGSMISCFNCLFEFLFKYNLDDATKEATQNVKNPGKP